MSYKVYKSNVISELEAVFLEAELSLVIIESNVLVNPELKYFSNKVIVINLPNIQLTNSQIKTNEVISRFPGNNVKFIPYEISDKIKLVTKNYRLFQVFNPITLKSTVAGIYGNLIVLKGQYLLASDLYTNGYLNLAGIIHKHLTKSAV